MCLCVWVRLGLFICTCVTLWLFHWAKCTYERLYVSCMYICVYTYTLPCVNLQKLVYLVYASSSYICLKVTMNFSHPLLCGVKPNEWINFMLWKGAPRLSFQNEEKWGFGRTLKVIDVFNRPFLWKSVSFKKLSFLSRQPEIAHCYVMTLQESLVEGCSTIWATL